MLRAKVGSSRRKVKGERKKDKGEIKKQTRPRSVEMRTPSRTPLRPARRSGPYHRSERFRMNVAQAFLPVEVVDQEKVKRRREKGKSERNAAGEGRVESKKGKRRKEKG